MCSSKIIDAVVEEENSLQLFSLKIINNNQKQRNNSNYNINENLTMTT